MICLLNQLFLCSEINLPRAVTSNIHMYLQYLLFFRIMPVKAQMVIYDFLQVGVGEHVPADEKKSD